MLSDTTVTTTSSNSSSKPSFEAFTPRMAWLLMAPHTWPAALLPVLVTVAYVMQQGFALSISLTLTLLLICVCLQAAANVLNDYVDFVRGTDSCADNVEIDDAVLVYNRINPHCALYTGIALIVLAFVLGIYPIYVAGFAPFGIACVGALVVVLYSAGNTPISYVPLAELIIGISMGCLIPFASFIVLTNTFNWWVLLWSLPLAIGIALIMLTNNTCDIEKDIIAKRKTLSVQLGRLKARKVYHSLLFFQLISSILLTAFFFTGGLIICPFMLLLAYPFLKNLWKSPLTPETRIASMGQICTLNIVLGTFYALCILASGFAFTF